MRLSEHGLDGLGQEQATGALAFIKGQMEKFYQLPNRITTLARRTTQLEAIAVQKAQAPAAQRLRDARNTLAAALADHARVSDRINALLGQLGAIGVTLGAVPAIPLAVAAQAALVAGSIASVLKRVSDQQAAIAAVERVILSPEEAAKLGTTPGGRAGAVPLWAYLAVLGLGGAWLYSRRRGR